MARGNLANFKGKRAAPFTKASGGRKRKSRKGK